MEQDLTRRSPFSCFHLAVKKARLSSPPQARLRSRHGWLDEVLTGTLANSPAQDSSHRHNRYLSPADAAEGFTLCMGFVRLRAVPSVNAPREPLMISLINKHQLRGLFQGERLKMFDTWHQKMCRACSQRARGRTALHNESIKYKCVCVYIYIYMHVCRLCCEIDFCASQGMRDIKANYAVCCAFVLILNKQAGERLLGIHCNQYYCKVSLEALYWE